MSKTRVRPCEALNHTDVINRIAETHGYRSYLEIGVQNTAQNYDLVCCPDKTGVDSKMPGQGANIQRCTSDEFFRRNTKRFDLIFIDGDHHEQQVERDIQNALAALNPGGAIRIAFRSAHVVSRIGGSLSSGNRWLAI